MAVSRSVSAKEQRAMRRAVPGAAIAQAKSKENQTQVKVLSPGGAAGRQATGGGGGGGVLSPGRVNIPVAAGGSTVIGNWTGGGGGGVVTRAA